MRNEKIDCVFGRPKQQNEGLIKKSPGPNCPKVDEIEEVSMADDEDGKPETRVSKKDIAGRVTFVEIIIVVVDVLRMLNGASSSGEDSGTMLQDGTMM
jgi:hypothetical protein